MTALVVTVFLASLMGSLHCAGMCGPFVVYAVDPRGTTPGRPFVLQLAYHGGRFVTYVLLGALAGWVGSTLDLGGAFFGIQRAALLVAGAMMILFGLITLLRLGGVRIRSVQPPAPFRKLFLRLHGRVARSSPLLRALGIGLGSTLLPCGWLYAFVITAAGSGSVVLGGATMALFWAGTLPVLVGLGLGFQRLSGPLRRRAPALTALALMVVGLMAVAGRFNAPPLSTAAPAAQQCHDSADEADIPAKPVAAEDAPRREVR